MNIRNKDLNLLVLFSVIYEEKNLGKVSARMALSQPALSHKLNKLRHEFHDPLFVRSGRGLEPTPKAHELATQVCHLVKNIEGFYSFADDPDFLNKEDSIHIYTTDFIELILLPRLLQVVREKAPKVRIITHNTRGALPLTELEQGRCDLAIAGFFNNLPNNLYRQQLRQDRFAVLYSKNNTHIKKRLTVSAYVKCPHVITSLTGDLTGTVDKKLKELGKKRTVVLGAGSFLVLPQVIRGSDLLLTCLKPIADNAVAIFTDLAMQAPPIDLPIIELDQVWHSRTHEDPLRKWLRVQIKQIMEDT